MLNTALLFLIFKRPDVTEQVFKTIRQVRPSRLYVAGDGAGNNQPGETEKVLRARQIVLDGIDWPCEVKILFRDTNLGCRMAVSSVINWFFEHEEEGIILEYDCLPDLTFFQFCEELLRCYRHDTRIMTISGDNFQQGNSRTNYSYYFSRYPHCWGWATWKRAWKYFDSHLSCWSDIKTEKLLHYVFNGDPQILSHWIKILDRFYLGNIDTWDFPWMCSCWLQSGLTIIPDVNLVSNIGFNDDATHTKTKNHRDAFLQKRKIQFPLLHPPYITRNVTADAFFDQFIVKKKSEKKYLI
ncbi:hypothetical protein VU06_00345 [Desulfobulbus sp. F3]|nr:hypothetical protein [Desulfobulbus sp. F3]